MKRNEIVTGGLYRGKWKVDLPRLVYSVECNINGRKYVEWAYAEEGGDHNTCWIETFAKLATQRLDPQTWEVMTNEDAA